jgi:hypothetical protein
VRYEGRYLEEGVGSYILWNLGRRASKDYDAMIAMEELPEEADSCGACAAQDENLGACHLIIPASTRNR